MKPLPPGPRGHPIFGSSLGFRRDPLGTFLAAWREYGDLVRLRGPVTVYLVAHPDHLRHILVDEFENYPHPADFDRKVSASVGQGLVTTNGEPWRAQRRMAEPAFRREQMHSYAGVMLEGTRRMLDRWGGEPLDMQAEMQALTLDILARCLFRTDWSADAAWVGASVRRQLEHLNHKLISVPDLPEWVPTPRNRRFLAARRRLDELVYRLIGERRDSAPDEADLLTTLMHTPDPETGEYMTDRQLRDQVMTLFVAGHETVAATLTWVWHVLSRHPEITRRVRAELAEVLGDREPAMADVPNLKYLRRVLAEVLRLYPPLWQVARTPLRDDVLGGHRIPAGSFLLLSTYITHRNPAYWDNPEGFDPDRFTRERSAGRPRYAYFPFLGGPRNCVGMAFANLEMPLVVASVLRRFDLESVPGHPVEFQPDLTLRARHGVLVRPRRIEAACPAHT
ncbi:cytochrome P450 [Amycolatopsis anabasis]|uniref:cytochrome P450 n=1 Tax=Amycolatopsis anabasis TaxID=1840409 RepID=UPI00131B8A64|nr:cytochrome P450 [Amycolatopsis anabasis]